MEEVIICPTQFNKTIEDMYHLIWNRDFSAGEVCCCENTNFKGSSKFKNEKAVVMVSQC